MSLTQPPGIIWTLRLGAGERQPGPPLCPQGQMGTVGTPTVGFGPRPILQDPGLSAHGRLWTRSVSALPSPFLNTNDRVNILKRTWGCWQPRWSLGGRSAASLINCGG